MQSLVALASVVSVAWCASSTFTLSLSTEDDSLSSYSYTVYSEDDSVFLSNTTTDTLTGAVQSDGSLVVSDGSFFGIVSNYFTLTNTTSEYAKLFSIDSDGFLLYNSTRDYWAIPSGDENNKYILASNGASSTLASAVTVEIKALDADGNAVDAYLETSSTTSSSSSGGSIASPGSYLMGLAMVLVSL